MAKLFGSQVDHQKIPILGIVPESNASAPSAPVAGQLWYDSANKQFKYYDGTQWIIPGAGAGGPPTGAAGGSLSGSYPNPTLAANSVGTSQITDGSIQAADLAAGVIPTALPPSGAAGGDLAGSTYPNPVIANGAVTSAKILDGTITDTDVAAANKDGITTTAGMRTLGYGGQQAMPGYSPLNVIASTIPVTADVGLAGFKLVSIGTPTSPADAANKSYVDNLLTGLTWHQAVRLATTANVGLTGLGTLDGISMNAGDRILVKNQTDGTQNGVYTAAVGAWSRHVNEDVSAELTNSAYYVTTGTTNGDTAWVITNDAITVGTTSITIAQFAGPGAVTAGAGMTQAGSTLNVIAGDTSLTVAADDVRVNTAVIATVASLAGYVPTARTITAGNGLTGGGDLSANRTVDVVAGDGSIAVAADSIMVAPAGVDLTTKVTGVLPIANGGTNANSTANAKIQLGFTTKYAVDVPALTAGSELSIVHTVNTSDVITQFRANATGAVVELAARVIDATHIGVTADIAYAANALRMVVIG